MDRVVVSKEKFATDVAVMLRVMPRAKQRELEDWYRDAAAKRHGEKPDILKEIGAYIAQKLFDEARWEMTHPAPKGLGSPPPHR